MAIAATLGAIGALAFSNYLDQYKVGLEGMAAQESAEPMVDAAVQNLQSGANVYLSQYYFGPPIAQQITPVLQNYLLIANALHQYIEYSRCDSATSFFQTHMATPSRSERLRLTLVRTFSRHLWWA
jgi:hypothetical protein